MIHLLILFYYVIQFTTRIVISRIIFAQCSQCQLGISVYHGSLCDVLSCKTHVEKLVKEVLSFTDGIIQEFHRGKKTRQTYPRQ